MHIVTIKRLQQAAEQFRDAASELGAWTRIVKNARWRSFQELRQTFPDADNVDGLVVFNLRHNRYRLIAALHYVSEIEGKLTLGHVYIGHFLTHSDYNRWSALPAAKRSQWPPF